MNLILIGFKYSGKTSIGKELAKTTQKKFIDTDYLIQEHHYAMTQKNMTISDIYQNCGKDYFRHLEKMIIKNLSPDKNTIIATGGGSILNSENALHLKSLGKLIYLQTSIETLLERLNQKSPPQFLSKNTLKESFIAHYQERLTIYEDIADTILPTDNKSIAVLTNEIIANLRIF